MREQQLPLHLKLPDHTAFESYFAGPNHEALNYLSAVPSAVTWIWGEAATGKTHLLQSAVSASDQAVYLPLADLEHFGPFVLEGYDAFDVVCIDQLDAVIPTEEDASAAEASDPHDPDAVTPSAVALSLATQRQWEEALFRVYQEVVVERHHTLIVSSRAAPRSLRFLMPDLASRLLSGPVFRLQPLSDEECLSAIQLRAKRRGMNLPEATGQYLLRRLKRDMHSLCGFLDELDTASLAHQQSRLTIPLVKATLDPTLVDEH